MKRFAIGIQYLGTPYAGFSRTYGRSKLTALSLTEQLALNKGIGFERGDDLPSLKGYIETSKPTLGVLDIVEDALGKMCGERGRFDNLKSSSRTDAGVHGLRNVIHVDIDHPSICDPQIIRKSLNYYLESRKTFIHVTDVTEVPASFDARIDATARSYWYKILLPRLPASNNNTDTNGQDIAKSVYLSPHYADMFHFWSLFHHNRAWILDPIKPNAFFDPCSMHNASKYLIGEHDFASFQSARCQSSTSVRELFTVQIFHNKKLIIDGYDNQITGYRSLSPLSHLLPISYPNSQMTYNESGVASIFGLTDPSVDEIDILITGDSFLQRMVRNIVGLLVQVGFGKNSVDSVKDILEIKDRNKVTISPAPAHGLYLLDVHYDKERRKIKEQRVIDRYQESQKNK